MSYHGHWYYFLRGKKRFSCSNTVGENGVGLESWVSKGSIKGTQGLHYSPKDISIQYGPISTNTWVEL